VHSTPNSPSPPAQMTIGASAQWNVPNGAIEWCMFPSRGGSVCRVR
jgi:hypothetical protein